MSENSSMGKKDGKQKRIKWKEVFSVSLSFICIIFAISILLNPEGACTSNYRVRTYNKIAETDARNLKTVLDAYRADHNRYPPSFPPTTSEGTTGLEENYDLFLSSGVQATLKTSEDGSRYSLATKHIKGNVVYLCNNKNKVVQSSPIIKANGSVLTMEDVPEP